jgi:hypothetical protein
LNDKTPIFQRSADAELLIKYLRSIATGSLVRYDVLSSVIQRDVQREANSVLRTATKALVNEHRIFYLTVRGEGIKRVTHEEANALIPVASRKRISRQACRTKKKLTKIDYGGLTPAGKKSWNLEMTLLSFHQAIDKPSSVSRIGARVSESGSMLSLEEARNSFLTSPSSADESPSHPS